MRHLLCALLILSIVIIGCGSKETADPQAVDQPPTDRLVVATVNYPLAYFADRLGGDLVEVVFPAPAGEDPVFWSPDTETIAEYQAADLILLNGAGYAKWVERTTLPASKMVDTSAAFADRYLEIEGTVTHSHGPEGEHEHQGWAFTTWLDPTLAIEHARAVAAALADALPDAPQAEIAERLAGLEADLTTLDERYAAAAQTIGDEPLLFSHPVYQYFIARYGLDGHQVHWEPDVEPDGTAWAELGHHLDHHDAAWMIWEGEPLDSTTVELAERGITSIVFDPCGNRPTEGSWLAVMQTNATHLERVAESIAAES